MRIDELSHTRRVVLAIVVPLVGFSIWIAGIVYASNLGK